MSYTARAFVRIEDVEKLTKVVIKITTPPSFFWRDGGYDKSYSGINQGRLFGTNQASSKSIEQGGINCNENNTEDDAIALFAELAGMRDDVEVGQWFKWNMDWNVSDGMMLKYDDIREDCLQYYARAEPYQVADNWDKLKRNM